MSYIITIRYIVLMSIYFTAISYATSVCAEDDFCAGVAEKINVEATKFGRKELKVDSVKQSQIRSLCEVRSGTSIFYFAPVENLIVSGSIFDLKGRNFTKEKVDALTNETLGKTLSRLPLDKAISVGKGPVQVIEVTDPDCPYCRRASAWLDGRNEVTRKVFFAPIAHPKAIEKVKVILAAKDPEAEYHAYMRGERDKNPEVTAVTDNKAKAMADQHLMLVSEARVSGTPTFFVNGIVVVGADIDGLRKAIEKDKTAWKKTP